LLDRRILREIRSGFGKRKKIGSKGRNVMYFVLIIC